MSHQRRVYDDAYLHSLGWQDTDDVIACYVWNQSHTEGVLTHCELCRCPVSAWPASIEKSAQKGWHIICRPCADALINQNSFSPAGYATENGIKLWD